MTGERRPATSDAAAMARVLAEIIAGQGTGVEGDADFVRARYFEHPARVASAPSPSSAVCWSASRP